MTACVISFQYLMFSMHSKSERSVFFLIWGVESNFKRNTIVLKRCLHFGKILSLPFNILEVKTLLNELIFNSVKECHNYEPSVWQICVVDSNSGRPTLCHWLQFSYTLQCNSDLQSSYMD